MIEVLQLLRRVCVAAMIAKRHQDYTAGNNQCCGHQYATRHLHATGNDVVNACPSHCMPAVSMHMYMHMQDGISPVL